MAIRSSSIIYTSSTDFEGLDFQDNTRQKLWDLTKTISDLQIKLEAEKKRNSHLEENYTKLPANLESLKESQAELESTKSHLAHLSSKLKESQSISAKFKKDLEDFREYAFREIKDKELYIISQSSNIRSLQNEINTFKDQCQKVCEEYESRLKHLKGYKSKYKHAKEELRESKTKSSMNKLDSDYLNLKLELESAQRKVNDLTRSREDLARKCNDLEMKNQHLTSLKSDFKATLHRRDRTLAEMEYDFKFTLEGIESNKVEETSELLEKITSLERQIKDLKAAHEVALNLKDDEKAKEKYKGEDIKRQMEKLAKDKQRSDLELAACKGLLDESNNEIIEVRMEFEAKIEGIKKEHKEKVFGLKTQIDDLNLRNKELVELTEVNRVSIYAGDSLADELGRLNNDFRDSRMVSGIFKESIFRAPAENDKNLEKLKKIKEKKKKIKEELTGKSEILNELERNFKKSETLNRNLNSDIVGLNDIINDMKSSIKRLELEKLDNESEISRFKNLNNELMALNKEVKDKALNVEYEMSKQKTNFEESVMALKKKYNDKILKYKEDILDLTQNSAQLRNNLTTSKTITAAQASELEASKDLLKKNSKLKEKAAGLENCLKSKTELINKLQSKLSELYRIPNVDANLDEDKGMPIIDEQVEADQEGLENENKDLKLKIKNLDEKIEGLLKVVNAEKEILVVKVDGGADKRVLSVGGVKGVGVEKIKGKLNDLSEDYVKVISEKIREVVKEIGFSVEVVKSQGLIEESKPREKRLRSDSLESDSEEDVKEAKGMSLGVTETTQVYLLSHPSASSPQLQELEQSLFSIQQDLKIKTERFQKCELDYQDRVAYLEETIKKLEEERAQYTYVTNTEMDEYTDSDEEKSQLDSKKIAVSIIDEFEPTEGSLLDPEDYRNPFDAFKESILLMKPSESDNTQISNLEVELAEKSNLVRQLQEQLKDLENQLENAERNNNEVSENFRKLQETMRIEKKNGRNTQGVKPIHDCVLLEARMTLLEAHNHRLETELIVSKTNWGEMTNTLIRDINDMESKLKIAENDTRILSEEKEELVKRINDRTTKKPSKWNIFSRKKRNSDIN